MVVTVMFRCMAPKGKGENDYRPLFDAFVNDVLTMTNMPEWPSAELVLKILGALLVCVHPNFH